MTYPAKGCVSPVVRARRYLIEAGYKEVGGSQGILWMLDTRLIAMACILPNGDIMNCEYGSEDEVKATSTMKAKEVQEWLEEDR